MEDFVPDLVINFQIVGRSDEIFYEDFSEKGLVRGIFLVESTLQEKLASIDFYVLGPNKRVIFSRRRK